jgi:DNA ligase (NAD+)
MDKLMNTDIEELLTLEEFGEISAKSVLEFFLQPQTKDLIVSLKDSGVQMESKSSGDVKSDKFKGLTFVLTGTLPNMTRDAATAIILSHKGKVSGSVSKNTSYVVAGEEAGSKLDKANLLGLTVLDETEFLKLANISSQSD